MRKKRCELSARSVGIAAALIAIAVMTTATARAELAATMRVASLALPGSATEASESPGQQVTARIDLSDQKMLVYVGDHLAYEFTVSTGRKGYGTPPGRYQVQWIHAKWRSRKYDNAPMPWSVFFHGGYAIHGTTAVRRLGRPASHGCVRLHPDDAKVFYRLVRASGLENTTVSVVR